MLESINKEHHLIDQMQRRWMIGSGEPLATDQLPESWRPLLSNVEPRKQALFALALSSQHQTWLFEPEKPDDLFKTPELPILDIPLLPDPLRPLFCRIVETTRRAGGAPLSHLLQLLLKRHCTVHPADWMPSLQDQNIPPIYWPWCRWIDHACKHEVADDFEILNSDNWNDFYPAERLEQLRKMRNEDRTAARILIEKHVGSEAADKRVKIIETLAIGLNEADATYLKKLTKDRSQKVSQQACRLLSRLGLEQDSSEDEQSESAANELAEYFEVKKSGILGRNKKLVPKKLKSKKQQSIRTAQLETVSLRQFARALNLALMDLASIWSFTDNRLQDNHNFVFNAIGSLPENELRDLLNNLIQLANTEENILPLIQLVLPRLQEQERTELVYGLLKNASNHFSFLDCLSFIEIPLTRINWEFLIKTNAWKTLIKELKNDYQKQGYIETARSVEELNALGLFLPQETAQKTVDMLAKIGLPRSEPALNSLNLNAQLNKQAIEK